MPQKLITGYLKPKPKTKITDYFKKLYSQRRIASRKCMRRKWNKEDYCRRLRAQMIVEYKNLHNFKRAKGFLFAANDSFTEFYAFNLSFHKRETYSYLFEPSLDPIATAIIDDNSALIHISVSKPFRRMGIGKELVRFITERAPQFHVFGGQNHNSRYRLTHEGMCLVRHCLRLGILDDEQFIEGTVPQSPLLQH